jgi:hypothetical protein
VGPVIENFHSSLRTEIAHLIRPWFTHLGVLEGPTQIGVALYPIEHQLAGPMDVIMSTGFERMEDDSEDASDRVKTSELGIHDFGIGI